MTIPVITITLIKNLVNDNSVKNNKHNNVGCDNNINVTDSDDDNKLPALSFLWDVGLHVSGAKSDRDR